jgi:hypothetical protein
VPDHCSSSTSYALEARRRAAQRRTSSQPMSGRLATEGQGVSLCAYFEGRASELADLATLEVSEQHGAVTLRLRPRSADAVGVALYLLDDVVGTVAFTDQASVRLNSATMQTPTVSPLTTSSTWQSLVELLHSIWVAVVASRERATDGRISHTWNNAWPWPGWRRRATRVDYAPYA